MKRVKKERKRNAFFRDRTHPRPLRGGEGKTRLSDAVVGELSESVHGLLAYRKHRSGRPLSRPFCATL